jgi:hypothetical protein
MTNTVIFWITGIRDYEDRIWEWETEMGCVPRPGDDIYIESLQIPPEQGDHKDTPWGEIEDVEARVVGVDWRLMNDDSYYASVTLEPILGSAPEEPVNTMKGM